MGILLPPSVQDNQRLKDAQLRADFARLEAPDQGDAKACQRRLQGKDPRLELCWGSTGPHARRWVVVRNAEDGQRHVVKVFQNEQGGYERPDPAIADRLMDITGRAGTVFLKELEREFEKQIEEQEKHNAELDEYFVDRVTSDLKNMHGIKDSIVVPRSIS